MKFMVNTYILLKCSVERRWEKMGEAEEPGSAVLWHALSAKHMRIHI